MYIYINYIASVIALLSYQLKKVNSRFDESYVSDSRNYFKSIQPRDTSRGPYIVHIDKAGISSEDFTAKLHEKYSLETSQFKKPITTSTLTHTIYGAVISGLTREEILKFSHVIRVVPDSVKRVRFSSTPWGLDRINQDKLPLDNKYSALFTGANIDVYVVDTGIDTTHVEFNNTNRVVKNIYDSFAHSNKHSPKADNDDVGHGTHCSGTIGGRTVGVSPRTNLYGLKILNSDGEGSSSDIIIALDYIASLVKASKRLSVVSMSLGGPCEEDDCSSDSLVLATEALTKIGIVVTVAAGNEGCNACYGSPNAAQNAIAVAATDQNDQITYFSNYGQCIDVSAPGYQILSACAKFICGNDYSYIKFSGTSMACPHTAGVVAQILEKLKNEIIHGYILSSNTTKDVLSELACQSTKSVLKYYIHDTITKNFLLHIPNSTLISNVPLNNLGKICNYVNGCIDDCSSSGYCLPANQYSSSSIITPQCYCQNDHYGSTCSLTTDPNCQLPGHMSLEVNMLDSFGDGWTFSSFSITDTNGYIVDNAYDSLCTGDSGTKSYCIPPGNYVYRVNRGYMPHEISWSTCGVNGGAPTTIGMNIQNGRCTPTCISNYSYFPITLYDSYEDGWNDGYYAIYSEASGDQIHGGTLSDGARGMQAICLPQQGCSILLIEEQGKAFSEISYEICGYKTSGAFLTRVCVDSNLQCTASLFVSSKPNFSANNCVEPATKLSIALFDPSLQGFSRQSINISNSNSTYIISTANKTGFSNIEQVCIPDGCYSFTIGSNSSLTTSRPLHNFWSLCGFLGKSPVQTTLCIEREYNLCYGLEGCLNAKSYAHRSDLQRIAITMEDPETSLDKLLLYNDIHGAHNLCSLVDGSYKIIVGSGKYYAFSDTRNQLNICNQNIQLPFTGNLLISSNKTICSVHLTPSPTCPTGSIPQQIIKLDTYGDGWGAGNKYIISTGTVPSEPATDDGGSNYGSNDEGSNYGSNDEGSDYSSNSGDYSYASLEQSSSRYNPRQMNLRLESQLRSQAQSQLPVEHYITRSTSYATDYVVVYEGTLAKGEIGFDSLCLSIGTCYNFQLISFNFGNEILWLLCGYLGDNKATYMTFCVTSNGCEFQSVTRQPGYYTVDDDDFPDSVQQLPPSMSPVISTYPTVNSASKYPSTPMSVISTISPASSNASENNTDLPLGSGSISSTFLSLLAIVLFTGFCVTFLLCITNYRNIRSECFRKLGVAGSKIYDPLAAVEASEESNNASGYEMATRLATSSKAIQPSLDNKSAGDDGNPAKKSKFEMNPILLSAASPGNQFRIIELDDEDENDDEEKTHADMRV